MNHGHDDLVDLLRTDDQDPFPLRHVAGRVAAFLLITAGILGSLLIGAVVAIVVFMLILGVHP